MAYKTAAQAKFAGGLNLREGADVVRADEAIDAMNVLYLPAGGVGQRAGTRRLTPTALTNRPDSLGVHLESDGTRQLLVGNANRIDVLNTVGVSVANVATAAAPHSFVRYGAPGVETTLIANGSDPVRSWDGSQFATPTYTAVAPTGKFLAVMTTDNRLVSACEPAHPERARMSDPGLPTVFAPNNYVDFHPGSGESLTAVVGHNDGTYFFKQSEFFIVYSTGTDSTGEPVFNFRHVAGAGSVGAACSSPEGVYFLDRRGVYLTTGGRPTLVSGALDPLFLGGPSLFYLGGIAEPSALLRARLWWAQGRLYLAFATSAMNDRLAVFSPRDGWWTLFDLPVAAMTSFRPGGREELAFAYASGANHVVRYFEGSDWERDDQATDGTGGNAITSRWRSGWVDYDSQDSKTIRQTKMWGQGALEVGISRDYRLAPGRYGTVQWTTATPAKWDGGEVWDGGLTWGPHATTEGRLLRQGVRGTVFSVTLRNSILDSSWSMRRLEQQFRDFSRGPEVVGTERT